MGGGVNRVDPTTVNSLADLASRQSQVGSVHSLNLPICAVQYQTLNSDLNKMCAPQLPDNMLPEVILWRSLSKVDNLELHREYTHPPLLLVFWHFIPLGL